MDGEDIVSTIIITVLQTNHDWYLLSQSPNITSIMGYFLSIVNNVSQPVSFGTVGEGNSLSIIISNVNSTYYNITVYAITDYRTISITSNGSFSELTLSSLQCGAVNL